MLFPKKYKYLLTCDLETTGTDVHRDSWITGSFGLLDFESFETIKELELKSKPLLWSHEAYEIHLIREEEAMDFPPRIDAIEELIEFIPDKDDFLFLCHANTNDYGSFYHFDYALLKMDFGREMEDYSFYLYFKDENVYSTHTIARKLRKKGIISKGTGLSLEELCDYFSIPYGKHDSRLDRKSMEELLRKMNAAEAPQMSFI